MNIFFDLITTILLSIFFISFMLKNVITTIRTKQTISGKSTKVYLVILSATILGLLFFRYDHFLLIKTFDVNAIKILGLVILTLACIIGISTLFTMKDSWRIGIRSDQKTDLITNGLFQYSRNPFYLSFNLMFFGIFLEFPTLVYLIFYLTFIIILHLIIIDEEKFLIEHHGDLYKSYKDSVNRYLSFRLKNKK